MKDETKSVRVTRRDFIRASTIAAGAGLAAGQGIDVLASGTRPSPPLAAGEVALNLLDGKALPIDSGVSFGVPWPQGAVKKTDTFALASKGKPLPAQSWPLAYWPDGSIKFIGLATVVPAGDAGPITLRVGGPTAKGDLKVSKTGGSVIVDTGVLKCTIPTSGSNIVDSMSIGGKEIATKGQLVCILQNGPQAEPDDVPPRERFVSTIKKVEVEQSGPVRATIKIEGMHKGVRSGREWLPFSVRLYFYTGQTAVRVVHTIIFDGDQEKDFVRGLGLQFGVPMREEPRNRTVRFAGEEGGVFSEPLQPGGGNRAQENGEPFAGNAVFAANAIWDDFRLSQPNPDGFTIRKRTNPKSTWISSWGGGRSAGLAFVGDLGGGLGVSVKNFWQSYPAALDVTRASSKEAGLTAWLWSPDGPEMDMRHYDLVAHTLAASYEDVQSGMSTAYGVSRTSELTLYPTAGGLPTREVFAAQARQGSELALLSASPEYIHSTGVFGVWSVVDRSTAFRKGIEDGLDQVLEFYKEQIDSRRWYGYWHYGDFMHSYSAARHVWHYDWGGTCMGEHRIGCPAVAVVQLSAHGPRGRFSSCRGAVAKQQRDVRL